MTGSENIRNFCIIAHIDHGKSTLADRFLELTGTVEKRKMQTQYLDQMDLERERGITIKMAPVRMTYSFPSFKIRDFRLTTPQNSEPSVYHLQPTTYNLNLIDTPGHTDFAYEVSRALEAVEGAIILVDASQGIQAQTLANFRAAEKAGLKIIGAVSKVDLFGKLASVSEEEGENSPRRTESSKFSRGMNPEMLSQAIQDLADLIGCGKEEIRKVSGKTGEGARELLHAVISNMPPPQPPRAEREKKKEIPENVSRALIFDSFYDNHKGIVASVRVFNGRFKAEEAYLITSETRFKIKEVGVFMPKMKLEASISEGEIGYIATGLKDPEKIKIGDTILNLQTYELKNLKTLSLLGYKEPQPVVFVSFYPKDGDEHELLYISLQKLKLNDCSITIEPDKNEVLGRGFKVGFLGRLHFEIVAERLLREFKLETTHTFPSVAYKVKTKGEMILIVSPDDLPEHFEEIWEPMVRVVVILVQDHVPTFFSFQSKFRLQDIETEVRGNRVLIRALMPLMELMSDFDDQLKSATGGYGSFSYEMSEYQKSDIVKVDILIAGSIVPGLSRFFHQSIFLREARKMAERLKELLPRKQFSQAIQAVSGGKIIAREDIQALKKNVTGNLYGGDRTRKMKLWKKQKRGKEKLKNMGEVRVSPEVFRKLLKK